MNGSTNTTNTGHRIVHSLAALYPRAVDSSEELAESLAFIESPYEPATVMRAGYGAGILSVVALLPLLLTPLPVTGVGILIVCFSLGVVYGVQSTPHLLAAFRRTEALGEAPNLIGRAVLRMQIQPSLEGAVRFAAATGFGPLAANLSGHIDRSMGTPYTGLLSFADEWSGQFPAVRRSAHLLATAQDAPTGERARTLDRALTAILDGTRNQMAAFTSAIRGPTTGLFAFGIMLPLALISLVPVIPVAGVSVSIWSIVVVYNLILPAGLIAASLWLLVRRPVAFPPPQIDHSHPDVPNTMGTRLLVGVAVAVGSGLLTLFFGPAALTPIIAVGMGIGVALLAIYMPIIAVRNHVRAVETHLTDALYLVGRQVAEGESVESAIELAADRVPAETGDVFDHAASLQRRLHLGVEAAFLGEYGALRDVPSPRARGTAALLAIAADEGQPAGRAIVSMADHLEELEDVEAETNRQLATVTDTLDNTTAYFGPLVAGATVGLAGMIATDTVGMVDGTTLSTDALGIVVGIYIILLCFILTPLSIALRYGLDRALFGYHIGRALTSAMLLYGLTVFIVGMIG